MSCVRDALSCKQVQKCLHTHTHTPCLRRGPTLPHTPETRADEQNDFIFPFPISSPVHIFPLPEAQTRAPIPNNLLTFGKLFIFVGVEGKKSTFSTFLWVSSGLFLQFCPLFLISLYITLLNLRYKRCDPALLPERTCSHIKCLVSYLGPFTAPLCPSKTASGLVQTLSGNNRWLLYCLRSFTL